MSKITFIGDVHGKWLEYCKIINSHQRTIQVGDFGIGFDKVRPSWNPLMEEFAAPEYHKFIRGNHDNPSECKANPNWIPDGTVTEDGIFCVGGAFSIDHAYRTEGVDWWRDEELTYSEFDKVINKYCSLKPDVVLTHDCPASVGHLLFEGYVGIPNITSNALSVMFEEHKPKIWIFGHWHENKDMVIDGTRFICIEELGTKTLDI